MQFLASFHILLTCSFVLLLAYALSRIFSYLASSVIHGSGTIARRGPDGSTRSRRISPIEREIEEGAAEAEKVLSRLQEEDEDVAYMDVETRAAAAGHASKYEVGDSIFDGGIVEDHVLNRDDLRQATWKDDEGMEDGGGWQDRGGGISAEQLEEYKDSENGKGWQMDKGAKGEGDEASKVETAKEAESKKGSKVGDAQGSSSQQQRLPPTWSDLERMVINLSFKERSYPPPLDE